MSSAALKCANPKCTTGKPPVCDDGKGVSYCGRSCRFACGPQCANPLCPTGLKAWNGKVGSYCDFDCRLACIKGQQCSATNYAALIKEGGAWAKSKGYSRFYPNPNLQNPSNQCRTKYEAGVKALRANDIASDIRFAWHGNPSHQGLLGIASSNLDTARRRRSAYGIGEYFSESDATSKGYASNTGFLIVCALLKKAPYTSTSPHLVVSNPTSGDLMYCLPLGAVLQPHQESKGDPFVAGYVP